MRGNRCWPESRAERNDAAVVAETFSRLAAAVLGFAFVASAAGCGSSLSSSKIPGRASANIHSARIPGNHFQDGRLGLGYNSYSQMFVPMACVTGDVQQIGAAHAELEYHQDLNFEQVSRTLSLSLGWSIPLAQLSSEMEFIRKTASSTLSHTHSVFFKMKARSEALKAESLQLTDSASALSGNGSGQVLADCGNEFVSQVDYGGALVATLRLDFASLDDKKEFNARVGLGYDTDKGTIKIDGSLGRISEKLKIRTRVTVVARQFGGQPAALLGILPGGVASCTLESLSPCAELFTNLVSYGQQEFQSQFSNAQDYVPVAYQTTPYSHAGSVSQSLSWPKERPENHELLMNLGDRAHQMVQLHLLAERLLQDHGSLMDRERLERVRQLSRQADDASVALRLQIEQCLGHSGEAGDEASDQSCKDLGWGKNLTSDLLYQPLIKPLVLTDFDRGYDQTSVSIVSQRRTPVEARWIAGQDSRPGALSLSMTSRGARRCIGEETFSLVMPVQVATNGMYELKASYRDLSCSGSLDSASCRVALVANGAVVTSSEKFEGHLAAQTRFSAGLHAIELQVSGQNLCKGDRLGLSLETIGVNEMYFPLALAPQ